MSFNSRRRRNSSLGQRRNKKKNFLSYIPLLLASSFVLGLLYFIFNLAQDLFSNTQTENISAEIDILGGKAEVKFLNDEQWSPIIQGQKFFGGDSIKTNNNGRLLFTFFDVNHLYLDKNSELLFEELSEKSSGKKTVKLTLKKGRIWLKSSASTFAEATKSQLIIKSEHLDILTRSGTFDLDLSDNQETLRIIQGKANISVKDQGELVDIVNLELGQKLVINEASIKLLSNKEDIRSLLDSDFVESEWHLRNLEKFSPQEVQKIRRKIELNTAKPTFSINNQTKSTEEILAEAAVTKGEIPAPTILTPSQNTRVPAENDLIKIEGTAPEEAFQISVNGYYLSKFQPGDRKWSYFGATKFNTLVPGENTYIIQAISRNGKKSTPITLKVFYEGKTAENTTTNTTATINSDINSFAKPVVSSPAFFLSTPTDTYQTSASVLSLKGSVDPKTNRVEVNGFVLNKFKPGHTSFSYIANADYGNLKEGLNIFKVVAFGPDGKTSTTEVRVVYSPIEL